MATLCEIEEAGYTADGLNRLIGRMLKTLVETMDALSLDERVRLGQANAHAFRHTFGTQSVADEVPVDVVQKVLGHASLRRRRSMCRPRNNACSKKSPAIMRGAQNAVRQRSSVPMRAFL